MSGALDLRGNGRNRTRSRWRVPGSVDRGRSPRYRCVRAQAIVLRESPLHPFTRSWLMDEADRTSAGLRGAADGAVRRPRVATPISSVARGKIVRAPTRHSRRTAINPGSTTAQAKRRCLPMRATAAWISVQNNVGSALSSPDASSCFLSLPRPGSEWYPSDPHYSRRTHMSDEDLKAEVEKLRAENERLKSQRGRSVSLKVSEK